MVQSLVLFPPLLYFLGFLSVLLFSFASACPFVRSPVFFSFSPFCVCFVLGVPASLFVFASPGLPFRFCPLVPPVHVFSFFSVPPPLMFFCSFPPARSPLFVRVLPYGFFSSFFFFSSLLLSLLWLL